MKRLLIPIIALFSVVHTFGKNQLTNIDPVNVVYCWDINDTLLAKDSGKRFKMTVKTAWHMMRSSEARAVFKNFHNQHGFCASEFVEHEYHKRVHKYLEKATQALNTGHKKLAKKYHKKAKRFMKLAHLFHNFELSYTNKDGIQELLNALKAHGHTQHYVASNIGIKHYEHIKKQFPEIFNDTMVQDGLAVNAWEEPVLKKPDHMYFKKLQKMFNPNGDKVLVFVDDKQANVDAACKCGLIGIHIKNVKQLVNTFNQEGLDLTYGKQKIYVNGKRHTAIQIA